MSLTEIWLKIFTRYNISKWKCIKKVTEENLNAFKIGLSLAKKTSCFICFNESPLKMMKNAFYFILKSTFRCEDI